MKIKIIAFALVILGLFSSCEEFLKEEYMSGENSSTLVSSEDNMELLINSCYATLRIWYGTENGWDLTEAGTDLYTWGNDNRSRGFCTYVGVVGEEQDRMAAVWYELYKSLNACNLALEGIEPLEYANPETKRSRKGELLFLRAHLLWQLTEIWGDPHFSIEPVKTAVYTAEHTPVSTFYEQVFADLDTALNYLPATTGEYGRIIEPIAKAFKARAHLYWASYNSTGVTIQGKTYVPQNSGLAQTHYGLAETYANEVINDYDYSLVSNWENIWSLSTITNSEVIFAVNYSDQSVYTTANLMNPWDEDFYSEDNDVADFRYNTFRIVQREGGHMGHLMYEIRYEDLNWGMQRDVENGRGFQRWMPTKYFLDLYNADLDQRFYGSFKNVWYSNLESNIPVWKPRMIVDGTTIDIDQSLWGKPMFELGDTAILFSKDPVDPSIKGKWNESDVFYFHKDKGYLIVDIDDMYTETGEIQTGISRQFYFPITKKYYDNEKEVVTQQYSKRDAFALRISEMYLIAAEAALGGGNSGGAYTYLQELADSRAFDGDGAALLADYGVAGGGDIDIDFILDERARELATETQRIFDLKRTGKLVERVKANNTDAAPLISDFHIYRFIPQEQLDAVRNPDEFTQNPGYN